MMKAVIFVQAIYLLILTATSHAQETIRITNGEWEPFLSQHSPHYGINSHIVSEAFGLEGIQVKWGFFPWKRAFIEARDNNQWDASAAWGVTKEVEEDFLVSAPISTNSYVFFHLKSRSFDWSGFEDLQGHTIGVTLQYDYGKEFLSAMKTQSFGVDWAVSDETNFKKLLGGRIDIFPNDLTVGYAQIRNTFPPEQAQHFTHHAKEFRRRTLHLIISKSSPHARTFLERFNSGLEKLKESGQLAEMMRDLKSGKYDRTASP